MRVTSPNTLFPSTLIVIEDEVEFESSGWIMHIHVPGLHLYLSKCHELDTS